MKNIVVCNQKGGVGKSLVADEIAFSLERSKLPTSFFDLDGQGGTLHETREVEGAVASVVDTPGALQRELADWLAAADAIVVPTRPTSRDIAPLMRMRDAILARSALSRTVLVVNGWNRFRASRDFMDWLKETDFAHVVKIPQSETFVQAGAADTSVIDLAPRSKAAQGVLEMCYAVRHVAGLPAE